jgi:hypothetical protein
MTGDRLTTDSRNAITVPLLLVLAMLASVAPFGIDLYLSAFPAWPQTSTRATRPSS